MRKVILACLGMMAMIVCMGILSGCAEKKQAVFVESGTTARVASDSPCPVCVKDKDGKDHCEKRNIGGMIVMPKTNYDELRRGYLSNSVKAEPSAVTSPPPAVKPPPPTKPTPTDTPLSPVELLPNQ